MLICKRLCYKVEEGCDLTGTFSFLKFVVTKYCKVRVELMKGRLLVKLCCPSSAFVKEVKARMNLVECIKGAKCFPLPGAPTPTKFTYFKEKGICIGIDERGSPVCLPVRWLERHALIVGSTGSGKSTTAYTIFSELPFPKLLLDWHGEHEWSKMVDCINLNHLEKLSDIEILDSFASSLSLSDAQYYILMKVLQLLRVQRKSFGIRDIAFYVKSLEETSRWMRESKYSLLRKLEMLIHRKRCSFTITDLPNSLEEGLVLNLSDYTEYGKRFVANVIISYLFAQAKNNPTKAFIFVEEAHNIIPKSSELSVADKVFMEGRKYGLHLVAITQSPKAMNPNAMKNTALKIIHALREVEDAKYVAESIGYPELWKEFISLEVGEAILSFRKPIRVFINSKRRSSSSPPRQKSTRSKEAFRTPLP